MCVRYDSNESKTKKPNDKEWRFENATIDAAMELTKYLMKKYAISADHVIRHYDVNGKYCPGVIGWNEPSGSEAAWEDFKKRIADQKEATVTEASGKIYRVQCGAFSSRANAEKLVEQLKAAGFDTLIKEG